MTHINKYFVFISLLLVSILTHAQLNEKIISFHSDIQVDTDGKITVTENIKVYGGESDIQRGIVRSIPLYRTDKNGKKVKMDVSVMNIRRDGKDEPYRTEIVNKHKEIYIGDANVLLEPGIYDYKIMYESYGHIGFFDGFDELYWNVTGNDWAFLIEKASANIILPDSVSVINTYCYTGEKGATASDCSAKTENNRITFNTNQTLDPGEGLTVAASFTPGIIKRPPPPGFVERLWLKYGMYGFPILALLIMFSYYFFTWRKVGVDPEKPIVVPSFNPPHGWSPAVVQYLYKKGYDNKAFTAALVSMAVNKSIRIISKSKEYHLVTTGDNSKISIEEKQVYNSLFPANPDPIPNISLNVSDSNHSRFSSAAESLKNSLSSQWPMKKIRTNNSWYTFIGFVLTLLLIILYAYLISKEEIIYFIALIPIIAMDAALFHSMTKNKGTKKFIFMLFGILAIVSTIGAIFFLSVILHESDKEAAIITTTFFTLLLVSIIVYSFLIKAPTKEGAQIKADLEGFRMYLKTAEENRLEHLTPPELTPELFERYLPYAIALGVENAWGKKFNNVLKAANYQPEWYVDSRPFTSMVVVSALSRSFSSSIRSAQVDPTASSSSGSGSGSWSSGSSGGGFSGGGGGGGGGRGW